MTLLFSSPQNQLKIDPRSSCEAKANRHPNPNPDIMTSLSELFLGQSDQKGGLGWLLFQSFHSFNSFYNQSEPWEIFFGKRDH